MKNIFLLFLPVLLTLKISVYAQRIASLEVKAQKNNSALEIPVQVNLDAITLLPDSILQLVEIKGKSKTPVAYQVEFEDHRILHWIIEPGANNKLRIFELVKGKPMENATQIKTQTEDGFLIISNNNKNLLRYNYKTIYPPAGVDTVFKRSGFIHPLWSPRGQELTRIHPPDHYHHWGLWNPWTEVLFEKDTVDFWNLAKKQGTVRFANFISTTNGNVYAEYKALHEHVVFKKSGSEKVAINEVQSVRIYQPVINNYYIADISIRLNCASESPVLLLEYRYGGLGLRATKEWNKNNSRIITSEGRDRKEADGSRARWCMAQGAVDGDSAGLVMMSYPTNYNYPEPLRVWPEDMNNRGDVFLNFSPTKNMNWQLKPGKEYVLKYRLLIFNDTFSKETAETAWQNFADPPDINVKINK
jgi:hypothetical protein